MKNYLWNLFASIKNGQLAKRSFIIQPQHKKLSIEFLNVLWDESLIIGYKTVKNNKNKFIIFLNYKNNNPVISKIAPISKPGQRCYFSVNQLWKIRPNVGLIIVSTTKGLLTLSHCKKLKIGGELLALIV